MSSPSRCRVASAALLAATTVAAILSVPGAASPSEPVRDLTLDEARGGHTLARHVGRTDDELRARLRREPNIAAASTYIDRETAERVVGLVLSRSSARISRWARGSGPRPNLALDYHGEAEHAVGRTLRRGERAPRAAFDALVILRWDDELSDFYVLTSYPEAHR